MISADVILALDTFFRGMGAWGTLAVVVFFILTFLIRESKHQKSLMEFYMKNIEVISNNTKSNSELCEMIKKTSDLSEDLLRTNISKSEDVLRHLNTLSNDHTILKENTQRILLLIDKRSNNDKED